MLAVCAHNATVLAVAHLNEGFLLLAQRLWNYDFDVHVMVTAAVRIDAPNAFAAQSDERV